MGARYDGHAEWYDERFRELSDAEGSAGVLADLLGPPDPEDPTCLDIGCGTGLHHGVVRAHGYEVIGLDLSADQLRVASARTRRLIRADGRRRRWFDWHAAALVRLADAVRGAVVTTTFVECPTISGMPLQCWLLPG